jgi:hypothetical protein
VLWQSVKIQIKLKKQVSFDERKLDNTMILNLYHVLTILTITIFGALHKLYTTEQQIEDSFTFIFIPRAKPLKIVFFLSFARCYSAQDFYSFNKPQSTELPEIFSKISVIQSTFCIPSPFTLLSNYTAKMY